MGLIRTICFIVLAVVLLFTWVSTSSDEKRNQKEEFFLSQLVDPSSRKIDENLAEELRFNCKLDLIHLKKAFTKRHAILPYETSNGIDLKTRSLPSENILRTVISLQPRAKQSLLDCLQKRNLLLRVSGEESSSKNWYSKYLEFVHSRNDVPRRYLQTLTGAPAPGPAIGSSSPSPAPSLSPSIAPSLNPTGTPTQTPFFPPLTGDLESGTPPVQNTNAGSGANAEGDKKNSSHKRSVVIAIAVTATVTFVIVAVLFLCCSDYCRSGSKLRRNDERPLLSLSMSDFSFGGASPKLYSFGNGNSVKDERIGHGHYTFGNNSSSYTTESSLGGSFHSTFNANHTLHSHHAVASGAMGGAHKFKPFELTTNTYAQANPPLKPPPGRPPLCPPLGRADPLPPEPPSSFKPPSAKHGPSLPPTPPPPPRPLASTGPPPPPPPPKPAPPPPPVPPPGPRPPPPPPPKAGAAPPPRPPQLPTGSKVAPRPPPPGPRHQGNASSSSVGASSDDEGDAPKAKLKPFFWDKVLANPDHSMVWHQIKSGSFQFDENMIESLFGYGASEKSKSEQKKESSLPDPSPQFIQITDAKKSQNLAILLRALNVTIEEVCDALREGNELPSEFVENLLKMAPTTDEELKFRLFNGDPSQLGPADRFLKALVDIPFAFKRLQALLFMSTLTEEVAIVKESLETLEVGCKELRNSRLFLKLLEAVLKTGNRMNDGTFRGGAQAFKLDTLLKLSDVKGTDGKTTLLHFVVREIIRSEGIRAVRVARENRSLSSIKSDDLLEEPLNDAEEHYRSLGLHAVSNLGIELENVKKASVLDADGLTGTVAKLGQSLLRTRQFLNSEMKSLEQEDTSFYKTLKNFVQNAEVQVLALLEEEKRIMALVKSTGDYFHGSTGKDEGLRLFIIVRDFLIMVDKACREVRDAPKKPTKAPKKETSSSDLPQLGAPATSSDTRQSPFDLRDRLFPAIADRRVGDSSSDDED